MTDILGPKNDPQLADSTEFPPVARPLSPPDQAQYISQPPVPREPFPSLIQGAALTLILLVMQIVCSFFFGVAFVVLGLGPDGVVGPEFLSIVNSLAAAITFWIALRWGRLTQSDAFPLKSVSFRLLAPMLLTSVGLFPLLNEIAIFLYANVPPPEGLDELFGSITGEDGNVWGAVLLLVVVAPMTEEPLFRGIMLGGFLRRYKAVPAILVSACLFAIIHLNLYQFVTATLLGVLYGWWFLRTRSLWPGLIGHALNNGMVFLVPLFPVMEITHPDDPQYFAPWFNGMALFAVLAGLVWTGVEFRRDGVTDDDTSIEPDPAPDTSTAA